MKGKCLNEYLTRYQYIEQHVLQLNALLFFDYRSCVVARKSKNTTFDDHAALYNVVISCFLAQFSSSMYYEVWKVD